MTSANDTINLEKETKAKELQLKVNGFGLFDCRNPGDLINPLYAYYAYFSEIPSVKHFWVYLDFEAAVKWIEEEYKDDILKKHTAQLLSKSDYEVMKQVNFYVIQDKMILTLETDAGSDLFFHSDNEEAAQAIIDNLKKFIIKDKENK
jgi:hypothetical protein